MIIQSIIEKIYNKSTKLLSLDIFDTLVFRLVDHPHQIFYETGKKAIKANLLHSSVSAEEFSLLRIKAEQDARKIQKERMGHNEVTLKQIYEFLPELIGDRAQLQTLEVMTECEYCYLNPEILKLIKDFKSQGLPVVLTSDMYLNKEQLKQILKFNGFDLNLVKGIHVSCEHNGDKSSGILFRKLQADFPEIPADQILHIGDKIEADVKSPKSLGMHTHHYDVIPRLLDEVYEFEKICGITSSHLTSLRKLAVHSSGHSSSIESQIGAGILGPALTVFCDWVLDICEKEGKKSVYPIMREAELLEPLLKNAAKNRQIDLKVSSLFVSRESTWLSSLKEWNLEECQNICNRHRISVKEILNSLGLDLATSFQDLHDYEFKSLNSEQQKGFVEFLISQPIKRKIEQTISERCKLLESYLIDEIAEAKDLVTVDLGFNGSINKNLENVFSKSSLTYSAIHLLAFGSSEIIKHLNSNIDIRSFYSSPGINQDLLKPIQRSSFPIEQLFFTGKVGSVIGYKKTSTKIIPITQNTNVSDNDLLVRKSIHTSIQNFQSHWYTLYAKKKSILRKPLISKSKRRIICSTITRLIELPTEQEAKFLGNLRHDYNHGSTKNRLICSPKDSEIHAEIGCEEKFLKTSRLSGVHWPQGVITKRNRYFLLKKKLGTHSSDSYLQTMNDLMEIVRGENFSEIIIYGAGEVGKSARRAAEINQIEVKCFVDRKKSLWGNQLENINIISLAKALEDSPNTPVAVGSFEFLEQIEETITYELRERNLTNRVFSVKDLFE